MATNDNLQMYSIPAGARVQAMSVIDTRRFAIWTEQGFVQVVDLGASADGPLSFGTPTALPGLISGFAPVDALPFASRPQWIVGTNPPDQWTFVDFGNSGTTVSLSTPTSTGSSFIAWRQPVRWLLRGAALRR